MIGLFMLTLRLTWWTIGLSIDLLFYIFTLGKVDPRVRKFF